MHHTRVLLECRVPNGRLRAATNNEVLGAATWPEVDDFFPPIPCLAADPRLQNSIDAENESLVLLRGEASTEKLQDLLNRPEILEVYTDADIFPFGHTRHSSPTNPSWRVEIESRSPTACPIPPCDCTPTHAQGTIRDVASHLGVDRLWRAGVDGHGVTIGVVDGGLLAEGRCQEDLPGLTPQVVDGWPRANWGTIAGWRRHGGMVASALLGVAPRASLIDIRVAECSSLNGRMSDAIAGIHWAIESYREKSLPQILCCGWGAPNQASAPDYVANKNHPLTRKVVEALDEGILVLFAAGNGGQSCPAVDCGGDVGPGRSIWGANGHERVMTVGAVNLRDQLIGYSSQGPSSLHEYKPDFCAASHFHGYFTCDAGTSTACAVACGVVALLKHARPELTQSAALRLLKQTAKEIGPPGWNRHCGSGVVQAEAAYRSLVRQRPPHRQDALRIEQIEQENQALRDLYFELVLEKKVRRVRSREE